MTSTVTTLRVIHIGTGQGADSSLDLGHGTKRISGSLVQAGTAGSAGVIAERVAAGAGGGAGHPPGGGQRWVDAEDGVADQPALSAGRFGTGLVRARPAGESGAV